MSISQSAKSQSRKSVHQHSRGYLRDVDEAVLKTRLKRPPYDALWQRLVTRTRQTMTRTTQQQFSDAFGALAWYSRTPMLHEAALLARLQNDAQSLAYIEACITYVTQYKPAQERGHLLHSHSQLAVAADMVRSQLSPESHDTLCQFMRDVAIPFNDDQVAKTGPLGSNISWVKSVQTAICALLWGEDSQVPNWREVVDQGIRHTQGYLQYGADEQGHSFEGTGYGQTVLRYMFPFIELLKRASYANLYESQKSQLLAAVDASIHSMFPDHSFLTNDNDHGLTAASSMSLLLLAHHNYRNPVHLAAWHAYQGPEHPIRPYGDQWPWLAKQLKRDRVPPDEYSSLFLTCLYWDADSPCPDFESIDLPVAQLAQGTAKLQLRTSWSKDAVFVQMLGSGRSHMSQTHRHADAGHLSIFAHGEYLAVDTGRYNSDEDQHSVMLVDGKCHAQVAPGWGMDHHAGSLKGFCQHPPLTYIRADMAHVKGCSWADRHMLAVLYHTDQLYIVTVDDINKDNEHHDFWWQLQGHPDATFHLDQPDTPLADDAPHARLAGTKARLDLHFVSPAPAPLAESQEDQPWPLSLWQDVKEWQWPYGKDSALDGLNMAGLLQTSVRRPRLVAQLHQQGGRLLSLISPRRINEPALAVTRTHTQDVMGIEIQLGDFTDTILASPSYGWIDNDSLSAMTTLLWYRKDSKGKVVNQWTLDGVTITWK